MEFLVEAGKVTMLETKSLTSPKRNSNGRSAMEGVSSLLLMENNVRMKMKWRGVGFSHSHFCIHVSLCHFSDMEMPGIRWRLQKRDCLQQKDSDDESVSRCICRFVWLAWSPLIRQKMINALWLIEAFAVTLWLLEKTWFQDLWDDSCMQFGMSLLWSKHVRKLRAS